MNFTTKRIHSIKNNQTRHLSKTWHQRIAEKQVIRNNFLATGNIMEAKNFAKMLKQLQSHEISIYRREKLIYSNNIFDELGAYTNATYAASY